MKKLGILSVTKVWHRDTNWASTLGKMLVTELHGTGMPETINLLKKKKKDNTQNIPNICKVQENEICPHSFLDTQVGPCRRHRSARSEILELASRLHHDGGGRVWLQRGHSSDPIRRLPLRISCLCSALDTPGNLLGREPALPFSWISLFLVPSDLIHHPSFQTHLASLRGLRKRLDREGVRKPCAESGFLLHFQF